MRYMTLLKKTMSLKLVVEYRGMNFALGKSLCVLWGPY